MKKFILVIFFLSSFIIVLSGCQSINQLTTTSSTISTDNQSTTSNPTTTSNTTNSNPVITIKNEFIKQYEVGSTEPNWLNAATASDAEDGTITINSNHIDTSKVNMNQVGHFDVTYTVTDSSGNQASAVLTITIVDTTKPVFIGLKNLQFIVNSPAPNWLDGISATDNVDGSINLSMTNVDTTHVNMNTVGSFIVTYSVSDTNGNTTSQSITVTIIDYPSPILRVKSSFALSYEVGSPEPNWMNAIEVVNASSGTLITTNINTNQVDMNHVGQFDVLYDVTMNGKTSTFTLTITIVDTTKPVINGLKDLQFEINTQEPNWLNGVSATDNVDGQISLSLTNVDTSRVNMNALGSFTVTYTVTDSNGNTTVETINVTIVQQIVPVLSLNGENDINLLIGEPYVELGATATLNGNDISSLVIINGHIDQYVPGNYSLTYTIPNEDVSVTRTIHIINDLSYILVDDALEQAIRNKLGYTNEPITIEDALSFTELDLSQLSISNLSGLEFFKNLQYLNLSQNNITDLFILQVLYENGAFSTLPQEYHIYLSGNPLDLNMGSDSYQIILYLSTNLVLIDLFTDVIEDHDNDVDNATSIEIGTVNNASIQYPNDMDYFKLTLLEDSDLTIYTLSDLFLVLEVLDEQGNIVKGKLLGGPDLNVRLNISLPAGTYYIKVINLGLFGDLSIGHYQLLVEFNSSEEGVLFKDSNLEEAIRIELNKPTGAITKADLLTIGSMDLSSREITDLTGIEFMKNANTLLLNYNNISDLTPLSQLTHLKYLLLDHNKITDLSPLRLLTNLKVLTLSNNLITDLSPLIHLNHLELLMIMSNQIEDISALLTMHENGAFINSFNVLELLGIHIFLSGNPIDLTFGSDDYIILDTLYESDVFTDIFIKQNPEEMTEIGLNTTTEATFENSNEIDVYKFTITEVNNVILYTTGNLDTFGTLYDINGTLLDFNDEYEDDNFRIQIYLNPGTYYIQVQEYNGMLGTYQFHLETYNDHNEIYTDGVSLSINNTSQFNIQNQFDSPGDEDYYILTVNGEVHLTIYSQSELDTFAYLYDSTMQELLYADYDSLLGTEDFRIQYLLTSGTYYLKVSEYNSQLGNYNLYFSTFSQDDNESFEEALPITIGSNVTSQFDYSGDYDYYYFVVSEEMDLMLYSISSFDMIGTIYDINKVELFSIDYDTLLGTEDFRTVYHFSPGTYYMRVEEYYGMVGSYEIHINQNNDGNDSFDQAILIKIGDSVNSQMNYYLDEDYYTFTLLQDTFISLYTISQLDTWGYLYDQNRNLICENDDDELTGGPDFRIACYLNAGTYYLKVNEYYGNTGEYQLLTQGNDDQNETFEQAVELNSTTPISSQFDYPFDHDYYRFEIINNNQVLIYSISELDTYATIYDANKNVILEIDEGSNDSHDFRFVTDFANGVYYLVIEEYYYDTGSYQLVLESYNPTSDSNESLNDAITIGLNGIQQGQFDYEYDRDYYRFTIQEGMKVMIYTVSQLDTYGYLYDDQLTILEQEDYDWLTSGEDDFRIIYYLTPGTYYIEVNEFFGNVGPYELHLEGYNDHNETYDQAIRLDTSAILSGEFNYRTDQDYYQFDVTGNQEVLITITSQFDTYISLFDQFKNPNEDATIEYGFMNDIYTCTLEATLTEGTYYVLLEEYNYNLGNYEIQLQTQDVNQIPIDAISVNLNSTTDNQFTSIDEVDTYSFTLTEDLVVLIYTTGNLDTFGQLYYNNNGFIDENDDTTFEGYGNNFRLLKYLEPGTYYIKVSEYYGLVGNYQFHIQTYNDHNECNQEGETLTIGLNGQTTTTSSFNYQGDIDYYKIIVLQEMYVMLYTMSDYDTMGFLYDYEFNYITEGDEDHINQTSDFRILYWLTPGTYYLKVIEYDESYTGDYELVVEGYDDNNESLDEAVVISNTKSSQFDYHYDDDYYRFTLTSSKTVTIYSVSSLDTYGFLYDSNGNVIAENDTDDSGTDDFKIEKTLSPGVYYIRIVEYNAELGEYELYIEFN